MPVYNKYIVSIDAFHYITIHNFCPHIFHIVWFGIVLVGYNTLEQTVKRICKKGNIDGHFTNHSLRATIGSRGIERGIPDVSL